jgi:hypothetical protein
MFIALLMGIVVGGYLLLGIAELITGIALGNRWWMCALPLALAAAAYKSARRTTAGWEPISYAARSRELDMPAKLAVASAVLGMACIAVAVMPGYPKGFEASAYHLPNAVHLLQTGSLLPWDRWWVHAQPFNTSIVYAMLLAFLPEHVVAATSLVFALGTCVAIYRIGRLLGSDRSSALIAACGFLSVPIVAFSAGELEADVSSLFFVATATALVIDPDARRALPIFLGGCAAGLAYGAKMLHLIPAGILFLFVIFPPLPGPRRSERYVERLRFGAFYALGFLCFAGFWLVRNWVLYGNPTYPVTLPVVGPLLHWYGTPELGAAVSKHQFEWVRTPLEWLVYPWREWHFLGQNYKHSSGLGLFFAVTVVPAVVVAVLRIVKARERALAFFVAAACVVFLLWWYLGDRQPRYFMGAFVFLFPVVAVILGAAKQYRANTGRVIAAGAVAAMMVMIGSLHLIFAGDRVLLGRGYERHRYYEYPPAIDTLPSGSRLLVFGGRTWHYPLAGKKLTNVVYSYARSLQLSDADPATGEQQTSMPVTISEAALKREHINYIFADGFAVSTTGQARLVEIDRLSVNPSNNSPLSRPRVLYQVVWP